MLTRELLRFRRKGGFLPAFINPAEPKLMELAAELTEVYEGAAAARMRRAELEELTGALLKGARDPRLAAGLDKLIQDRCSFDPVRSVDYPAERRKLFGAAARSLTASGGDLDTYREALLAEEGTADFLASDIYGDLPDNERLSGWRALYPAELLNRYNVALVQGLLIYAENLDATVSDSNPAELRRLFKYLRFFRLLAEISRSKGEGKDGPVTLRISGPFALFANTRKYAVQLATFFPALVNLEKWSISAKIRLEGVQGELRLDESSGLVSHYRNFSSYVPEEIRMFHKLFKEQSEDWKIVGESPFLDGGGQEIVFPDLSFRRGSDGRTVHLELFHRWHRGQLDRRLALLERKPGMQLILGVDRALADDAAWRMLEAEHPALADRLFRFRDFPGVDRVRRVLDAFAENHPESRKKGEKKAKRPNAPTS